MARPSKPGLSYFPKDVDVFSDRKIKILMARYGSDGYLFYDYLLCEIYRQGYYIQMDDDFLYLSSQDLNMSVGKIGQMLNFLLERSLLNRTLFQSDKVLTSAGIQRRYQLGVSTRARKNPVKVNARFWLLNEEETEGFIKVTHFDDNSENNPHFSKNNLSYSENYDLNKSKEKKTKLKESEEKKTPQEKPAAHTHGTYQNVFLSDQQLADLKKRWPDSYQEKINYFSERLEMKGYYFQNHYLTIIKWAEEDAAKQPAGVQGKRTYDIEAYENFDFLEPFSNSGKDDSER